MSADVRIEQSPKRVRAVLGGVVVADAVGPSLVWEVPHYPAYYFPRAALKDGALVAAKAPEGRGETRPRLGTPTWFDVVAGAKTAKAAAWSYADSTLEPLRDLVRISWDAMDAWFEEEEEVFVHAHDPYKRIDILHASRHIHVSLDGVVLADSRRPTIVFETGAPVRSYLPKSDVRMDLLVPTQKRTGCAYKGFARYWSVAVNGAVHDDLVWSYPTPLAEGAKIAGLVSFFDERVDVRVDGVLVPRPHTEYSKSSKK